MSKKIFLTISVLLLIVSGLYAQGNTTSGPAPAMASTDKPARAPIFRPNKDQIMQVQKILKDKKLYAGDASGSYNDDTRTGIKSFQKDNGLKDTGTLNRATLEKFGVPLTDKQKAIPASANSLASSEPAAKAPKKTKTTAKAAGPSASSATDTKTPKSGKKTIFRATADQIISAQKTLKDKSMYAGDANGKLDDPTREGIKKYQAANGVKVTGTLNAATLEKMGIPLSDKQKAEAAADTPKN